MAELSSNRKVGNDVQVETENEKIKVMCSRCPQNLKFGNFRLYRVTERERHNKIGFNEKSNGPAVHLPNSRFCGEREHMTVNFLNAFPTRSVTGEFGHISVQVERIGIITK